MNNWLKYLMNYYERTKRAGKINKKFHKIKKNMFLYLLQMAKQYFNKS